MPKSRLSTPGTRNEFEFFLVISVLIYGCVSLFNNSNVLRAHTLVSDAEWDRFVFAIGLLYVCYRTFVTCKFYLKPAVMSVEFFTLYTL